MSRRLASIALCAIAATVLAACSTPSEADGDVVYHTNYAIYESADQLVDASDVVFVGSAISSEVRMVDISADPLVRADADLDPAYGAEGEGGSATLPYTVYQVRVEEVVSGALSVGQIIEVGFLGGVLDGVRHTEVDAATIELNASFALFLDVFDGDVPAQPVNRTQAVYRESEPGTFESVSLDNVISDQVAEELAAAVE